MSTPIVPFYKHLWDSGVVTYSRGYKDGHDGVDWIMPTNTPILASQSGIVLITKADKHGGLYIYVKGDDGRGYVYLHLSSFGVKVGEKVSIGQIIGRSGNTGLSTAPHLHFEIHAKVNDWNSSINPIPLIKYPENVDSRHVNINNMGQKVNNYQFKVGKGGWRSQVIQEIIDAGIWSGTWQSNESKFNDLNPIAPKGGWKPDDIVNYSKEPINNINKEIESKTNELQKLVDQKAQEVENKQEEINRLQLEIQTLEMEQQQEIEELKESVLPPTILFEKSDIELPLDFETEPESNKFKFTKTNLQKTAKGAAIAAAGSVLVYIGNLLEIYDFGEIEAILVWLVPTLINALREFAKD